MKALVIGDHGFVGRHLCPMLHKAGYEVYGTEDFVRNFLPDYHSRIHYDVIVHLGANIVNVDDRMKLGMHGYDDILLDYEVCRYVELFPPTKAFIAMSSCAVDYPDDPYCIVKRTLEAFAHTLFKKGVPVVTLRPFSGYGPDQSTEYPFRAIFERAMRHEEPLTVWGGTQVRDWLWIDDLCDGIMCAIEYFPRGGVYEMGTGIGTSLLELGERIARGVGYYPLVIGDTRRCSSSNFRVASQRGQHQYGWMPRVSLADGIEKSVAYFRAAGRIPAVLEDAKKIV